MLRTFATLLFGTKTLDDDTGPDVSRRRLLAGLTAAGGLVAIGSILVPAGDANAKAPLDPGSAAADGDVQLVQQRRRRDDDDEDDFSDEFRGDDDEDDDGVSGRSFRRRDRDRRDRGRRMSRREIRFRCRNDRRFRRNNRRLCDIASGGGRRNSCVQIGPVLLCD